jgi:hypothetical protein
MVRRQATTRVVLVAGSLALAATLVQVGRGAFGAEAAPAAPLISSAPIQPAVSTRATFAFDQQTGLTYACAVDENPYAACASPTVVRGLSRAAHMFRVRAQKPSGVHGPAAEYAWTVVKPASPRRFRPTFTTVPVRPWISRNATFAWMLKPKTRGECRLDGASWQPCANLRTYLGLRLGRHVFRLRARDGAGRRSSVNRFHWTITSSPAPLPPTISSQPDGSTTSTSASFAFSLTDGDAAECRLDGGVWVACSSVAMYVGLTVGAHVFCVRAVNGSGAVGPETCVSWTVLASPSVPEPSGPFRITGGIPSALSPGSSQSLALTVSNPFDFAIRVTSLTVTIRPGSTQPGCDGPSNLSIAQSNTSGGAIWIVVPARGSVTLPAQGATAPIVTMLDLPTNQDACKGAVFTADFSGTGVQS